MSGTKAFYFRSGTWIKIGDYPDIKLALANEFAIVAKRLIKEGYGKDALQRGFALAETATELEAVVKRAVLSGVSGTKVPNYDDVLADWFATVEFGLQEGPSRRRPQAIHDHHISPKIGARPINDIRRRETIEVLSDLFRDKPVTAGHALGHLNKVFERAVNLEFIDANPVQPRAAFPRTARQKKHHGTLDPSRMPELWLWLQDRSASETAKMAILTTMCTAHRIGVIVNAEWAHIDLETGIWTVPARKDKSTVGRMKSGRAYALKLPPHLLDLLLVLKQNPRQRYVFESPSTTGPISPNAILKLLKTFEPSLTTHGFRNSIKVWCRNAISAIPDYVADARPERRGRYLAAYLGKAEPSQRLFRGVLTDNRKKPMCGVAFGGTERNGIYDSDQGFIVGTVFRGDRFFISKSLQQAADRQMKAAHTGLGAVQRLPPARDLGKGAALDQVATSPQGQALSQRNFSCGTGGSGPEPGRAVSWRPEKPVSVSQSFKGLPDRSGASQNRAAGPDG